MGFADRVGQKAIDGITPRLTGHERLTMTTDPASQSAPVEPKVMLLSADDAWEFCNREWGYETSKRPATKLTTVPYVKSVLHDFLDAEGKTLMLGDDGHYYTAQDMEGPYGDYARTEWVEYGRFTSPEKVRAHLAT